jgi:hypothetical protein
MQLLCHCENIFFCMVSQTHGDCMQGFITDHERALEELFSENAEGSHKYNACLNTMATRISTVFASMKVFYIICKGFHCLNLVISVYMFVLL